MLTKFLGPWYISGVPSEALGREGDNSSMIDQIFNNIQKCFLKNQLKAVARGRGIGITNLIFT